MAQNFYGLTRPRTSGSDTNRSLRAARVWAVFLPHLHNVVHEGHLEHGVKLHVVVLEQVLQGTFGAVLREEGAVWLGVHAHPNEPHQVLVLQVLHLWRWRERIGSSVIATKRNGKWIEKLDITISHSSLFVITLFRYTKIKMYVLFFYLYPHSIISSIWPYCKMLKKKSHIRGPRCTAPRVYRFT